MNTSFGKPVHLKTNFLKSGHGSIKRLKYSNSLGASINQKATPTIDIFQVKIPPRRGEGHIGYVPKNSKGT